MDAMRIVIDDPAVVPALEDVRSERKTWVILGQVPKKNNPLNNKYKLVDKGDDWDDFIDTLDESKVLFCLVRFTVKEVPRFAFITFCGEGVPGEIKGKYGYHCQDMEKWIGHFHVQLNARSADDVTQQKILSKMTTALGAAYEAGQITQGSSKGEKVSGSGYKKDTAFQAIPEVSSQYWSSQAPASGTPSSGYVKDKAYENIKDQSADYWNQNSSPSPSGPTEKKTVSDYKNISGASSLKSRYEDLAKPEAKPEIQRTGVRPNFSRPPEPTPAPQKQAPAARATRAPEAAPAAAPAPVHHYEPEPAAHYEPEPAAHYEPEPAAHYEPPASHYEPPAAHYEPPAAHYEPPVAHYEPEPVAYHEPEATYEAPAEHYEAQAHHDAPAYEEHYEESYDNYPVDGGYEEGYQEGGYEEHYEEQYEAPAAAAAAAGGITCTALYDYAGENEGDLSFYAGDVIAILDQSDPSGWWQGEINGISGFFPMNFVQQN